MGLYWNSVFVLECIYLVALYPAIPGRFFYSWWLTRYLNNIKHKSKNHTLQQAVHSRKEYLAEPITMHECLVTEAKGFLHGDSNAESVLF